MLSLETTMFLACIQNVFERKLETHSLFGAPQKMRHYAAA
jgi:hypothetical protein